MISSRVPNMGVGGGGERNKGEGKRNKGGWWRRVEGRGGLK